MVEDPRWEGDGPPSPVATVWGQRNSREIGRGERREVVTPPQVKTRSKRRRRGTAPGCLQRLLGALGGWGGSQKGSALETQRKPEGCGVTWPPGLRQERKEAWGGAGPWEG